MPDAELLVPIPAVLSLHVVGVRSKLGMQVGEVCGVATARHVTLFGEQLQDASRRFLYHLKARRVIGECDVGKLDILLFVLQSWRGEEHFLKGK